MNRLPLALLLLFAPIPATGQSPAAPPAPKLTFAFELRAQVGPPLELGDVAHGRRRIVPIPGGTFSGSGINGRIVPGGADWQIVNEAGFTEIDTRYTLETDQGELIYVQN